MSVKKWILRLISLPFFIIGLIGVIDTLMILFNPTIIMPWKSLINTLLIIGFLFGMGYIFFSLSMNNRIYEIKITVIFMKFIFVLYLVIIITVVFGDATFARHFSSSVSWTDYISSINFIPFKTIINYVVALFKGNNSNVAYANLIGNILAFVPMGFFLPMFHKKAKKFYIFFIDMLIILISIEVIQLLTMRGICDIDDIILNLTGASIVWKILNMIGYPKLNKLFNGMFE